MKFLSQPPELSLPNFEHYVYEESAGRGVNVYISDTGANLANQVSPSLVGSWYSTEQLKELTDGSNVAGRVRWLFGQGGGPINTDQVDLHIDGHGTCMLDKIGGYRYGVAKNVNPIVARAVHNHPDAFLDTVRQIDADYEPIYNQDPRTARAIINMSWGFPADQLRGIKDAWVNELRTLMQKLICMGATIVIPSGNAYPNKVSHIADSGHRHLTSSFRKSTSGPPFSQEKKVTMESRSSSSSAASRSTGGGTESFGIGVRLPPSFPSMHPALSSIALMVREV